MSQSFDALVGESPNTGHRWLGPELMLLIFRQKVERLMLAMGYPAFSFGHWVFLGPDDLTPVEVGRVRKRNQEALGKHQQVAVG